MDPFRKLAEMKTLLVDDNELIRDALILAFMNKGCLQATETAEEGLRTLKKERFNVIISDLKLSGIDGLEFFRQANVYQPNTVKVYIEKPFIIKKLITSLALLVEKHNAMNSNHG